MSETVGEAAEEVGERPAVGRRSWRRRLPSGRLLPAVLLVGVFLLMAAWPGLFTSADPNDCVLADSLTPPSAEHWFGLDVQGCDLYARTVHGARASMTIGLLVVAGAAVIAIVFGSIAGYRGGVVDTIISRLTDVWFGIPLILAGIVILTFLDRRGVVQVSLVLTVLAWPTMLRIQRASVQETKAAEYVAAARALGSSDTRILLRHVVPNSLAPLLIYSTIATGTIITTEAILSFLGVGLQLPTESWGILLAEAQFRLARGPHLLLPGLFLSAAVFGFILLGDGLRDALDPRTRR